MSAVPKDHGWFARILRGEEGYVALAYNLTVGAGPTRSAALASAAWLEAPTVALPAVATLVATVLGGVRDAEWVFAGSCLLSAGEAPPGRWAEGVARRDPSLGACRDWPFPRADLLAALARAAAFGNPVVRLTGDDRSARWSPAALRLYPRGWRSDDDFRLSLDAKCAAEEVLVNLGIDRWLRLLGDGR